MPVLPLFFFAVLALLASALGALLVALFSVGLGFILSKLLPFTLLQASFLGLASAVAFVVGVGRVIAMLADVRGVQQRAIAQAQVDVDDGDNDGEAPEREPMPRVILTTQSGDVPLNPNQGQGWRKRPRSR